jgi:subtilisin family serine protease
MKGVAATILALAGILLAGSHHVRASQQEKSKHTIVPGVGIGDYALDMSKDEVLRKLGKPKSIFWGSERYTLDNLPERYFIAYGDISFGMEDDAVTGIGVHSPLYKFANGLGVGDSEQKIKQAFGDNFRLEETEWKDFLIYEDQGLQFEIHKKNRTVMEIAVNQTTGDHGESAEALTPSALEPFDNVGGKDLRAYDLRNAGAILDTLEFNQETLWPTPDRLPEGFNPNALLQEGMNPGLGVRALHAEGITGAGVHVGLIDQPLLLDHPEYAGKIVSYHDAGCGPSMSSMHGPGMASQLVGKRCGTAPGAKLHVVAVPSSKADADYYARALDRLVAYNENAPNEQKIRVVSVSAQPSGEGSGYINQALWDQAVERAAAKGILVLDCTWHHGFVAPCWLDPQDRERVEACTPGFRKGTVEVDEGHIHVPSAPRTAAEAYTDKPFGYVYDGGGSRSRRPMSKGGYSDTIPYCAGILALGWQIRPDLTPTQIKEMLFASAHVHKSGAKIINPRAFIELIRRQNDNQQPDRSSSKDVLTLVRQAAAQGRISFKLTTPQEFKEIAGQPTKEWTYEDGEVIYMQYPGIEVKFFGKPELNTPHTVLYVLCEGSGIDIGQNRPIPLDLEKFDSIRGVRSKDLSRFDLSQQGERLKALSFNSHTVWPESDRLPPDFDPEAIMEWGKNPGLGIKQLHDQGVTGKGVQVAIIDQPLLVDHIEYASQLAGYTEIQTGDADPQMHGAAVASLLVGKTCGAAPGALLHFWAQPSWKRDYKYRCIALEQIIQFNRGKERAEQIRILSVSKGFSRDEPNLDRWKTLLEKARQSGIYVVHCGSMGFGAGCRFLKDSDNPANYRLCAFYQRGPVFHEPGAFFTPIDHRTTASESAKDAYTFYPVGGLSWGAPYYAGVVALGMQVNPDLRVDHIDKLLYDSGWDFQRGRLINPIGFVEAARMASSKGSKPGRRP